MKLHRIIAVVLSFIVCSHAPARAQDMDTELTKLTEDLASQIKDKGNKKVTVLDFTDLDGNSTEIGKYVADQLTVNFVMKKRDFSILDRAHLKKIMDEHKLTASGLVDPDNAKKLGQFAGVDAMIFGKVVPVGDNVNITVTIVTTDTAVMEGGGKAKFLQDDTVRQLASKPAAETAVTEPAEKPTKDPQKIVKTLGDLSVALQSLTIVNGSQYLLTMTLSNTNPRKSVWVALNAENPVGPLIASITAENALQFGSQSSLVSGIEVAVSQGITAFYGHATEIKPGASTDATVTFSSRKEPVPGNCRLQMEFLFPRLNPQNDVFERPTKQLLIAQLKVK